MKRTALSLALCSLWLTSQARAETYEVGEDKPITSLGAVPWESLKSGDVVRIHHRAQPYREKLVLAVHGTESAPIRIEGVPGPGGARPVIDGENATTRAQLDFWNEPRGLIKIGGASKPSSAKGSYIVLQGLELRGARDTHTFSNAKGVKVSYAANAAALFIEAGEHIVVRDCALYDSGNGVFVANQSADIRFEANEIADNGNPSSDQEHNVYSEALGIVFEGNHLRPLCTGCRGNNLKDRSAGLIARYNWIEGGNRALDLVDAGSTTLRSDPSYNATYVYGNVLVELDDAGNRQLVHWGGDSGNTPNYRAGTLYMYANTIVSRRPGRNTLLRNSSPTGRALIYGNIVHTMGANAEQEILSDALGSAELRHNFLPTNWKPSFAAAANVNDDGSNLTGSDPGFVSDNDWHLKAGSPCVNAGAFPDVGQSYQVLAQAPAPRAREGRPQDGMPDIGAIERGMPTSIEGGVPLPDGGAAQDGGASAQDGGGSAQDGGGSGGSSGAPFDPPVNTDAQVPDDYPEPSGDEGCSCRVGESRSSAPSWGSLALFALCALRVRRSSRRRTQG